MKIADSWRTLRPERYQRRRMTGKLIIALHHTAGNPAATPQDVALVHRQRGWGHIGYHYLIWQDGRVAKTLPLSYIPICVRGHNPRVICIAFVGNYQAAALTPEQLASVQELIGLISAAHRISRVCGHRDLTPTLCPGDQAYQQLAPVMWDEVG